MRAVKRVRGGSSDQLAVIAQRAQAFTNASGIAIALSEGNAGEIICRARAGSSAPEVGTMLRGEGTFTGLCIQSGKELCCDDAETDTRVDKAAIRALGIRSMVAVPVKEEGRVVGVLAAFAPTAHAFTITHVALLKSMADRIAAYLQGKQRYQAYSPEPLPSPPVKAVAGSAAASPAPSPRALPVAPNFEPVRASTSAEEIDPAPFSKKKKTNSHDEQKRYKTYFPRALGTRDAAAAPENRPGVNVLRIGAAVVVLVLAVGFFFELLRPAAAPQPGLETSSSPGTRAAPAPASATLQPPAKNIVLAPPANHREALPKREEAQPKPEEIVELSAGPSRISGAGDNSVPASDAPAISLDSGPSSGSPFSLASPVSPPLDPRLLTPSKFEPATVIKKVPPAYPLVAEQHRLRGRVVVQGTVKKNGRISDLQLISGPPVFREAAFEAVKQWVFKPARLNGQEIELSVRIHLDFGVQ